MSRNARPASIDRLQKDRNSKSTASSAELGLDEVAALAVIVVALTAIFLRTFA